MKSSINPHTSISYKSHVSSKKSRATNASLRKSQMPDLDEEPAAYEEEAQQQDDAESLPSAKPDDFLCCNLCKKELSLDEKVINARFVNEAIQTGRDISLFPICINCNFE